MINFILVRPRYPGNIGSAARAIKNLGFKNLILVAPSTLPLHPESRRLAVGAEDLLKKAKVFDHLEEAIQGNHLLVGTSRRTGKHRKDFMTLEDLPPLLPKKQKIGILFGPEERGLNNRELSTCHHVVTIPANPKFPSFNLAQSIAIVAYQLHIGSKSTRHPSNNDESTSQVAPVEELEGMYTHLEKMLLQIGFLENDRSFHMMRSLRNLLSRTRPDSREIRIIRGICRQVLWSTQNPATRDDKKIASSQKV